MSPSVAAPEKEPPERESAEAIPRRNCIRCLLEVPDLSVWEHLLFVTFSVALLEPFKSEDTYFNFRLFNSRKCLLAGCAKKSRDRKCGFLASFLSGRSPILYSPFSSSSVVGI